MYIYYLHCNRKTDRLKNSQSCQLSEILKSALLNAANLVVIQRPTSYNICHRHNWKTAQRSACVNGEQ